MALGLIFGVASEFQGRGVEAAMIYAFCKNIIMSKKTNDWLDKSWVEDLNQQMMHLMDYIGAKQSQTYITYRKLIRDDIEFCRSIDKKVKDPESSEG